MHPVDAEIDVLRALKARIIDRGYTPHIVEILAAYRCADIQKMIGDRERCDRQVWGREKLDDLPPTILCLYSENVAHGTAADRVAIIISEMCNTNLPTLIGHFLPIIPSARIEMITAITFQIYFTLAAIARVWSRFSHGDMSNLANVMILYAGKGIGLLDDVASAPRQYLRYEVDSHTFDVPFYGFFVKIIDFGHSQIPEEGIISAVEQNRPERADEFIADYIDFIVALEHEMIEGPGMDGRWDLFQILNPHGISGNMGIRAGVELQKKTPTLEESLISAAFRAFEVRPKDERRDVGRVFCLPKRGGI